MKPAFLKGIKLGSAPLRSAMDRDLAQVERLIRESLRSDLPFIEGLNETVLAPRGKRLRPALVLLAAGRPGESSGAVLLAGAVVEMIHTATLLHDDVVDGSLRRRGRPTLNAEVGDGAAILMGDYVYSRAITLLVEAELTQVLGLLATTVHRMSVGELLQLDLRRSRLLSEEAYRHVIYEKTARLIEACCQSGAILSGADARTVTAFGDFGRNVGMAFQIVDDVLDYAADPDTLGKPVGSDIAEGKQTLPLLLAHAAAPPAERARLETLLADTNGGREEILSLVESLGGARAALAEARRYGESAREALGRLPAGEVRDALDATVDYVIEREL
ncbi:MAG: polyprenyl synthetase family protein [Candidatus Krumholzibacteriia bacterium]|nr:polyprenyl synthetase family protein [bacterium]